MSCYWLQAAQNLCDGLIVVGLLGGIGFGVGTAALAENREKDRATMLGAYCFCAMVVMVVLAVALRPSNDVIAPYCAPPKCGT